MKTRIAAIVLALMGLASFVQADIPGPGPRPKPPVPVADKSVPMIYEVAEGNGPARLIIPKKFAGPMKAAIDTHSPDAIADNSTSRLPAMLAGIFLTLSLAFSGLWLVRSRGLLGTRTVTMIFAGIALLGLGGALLWANAPAPPSIARPAPVDNDRVIIEIVEQGEAVKFILPRNRMARLVPAQPQPPVFRPVPLPAPEPTRPLAKPDVQPVPPKPLGGVAPGKPGIGVGIVVPLPEPVPMPIQPALPEK